MTVETRTFISLDDLVGFELTCLQCKVKSVFEVGGINQPVICPMCGEKWFDRESDSRRAKLNQFFWQVVELKKLLQSFPTDGIKLSVRLEITSHTQSVSK
jgi:predicted RNA-binding Zn-ribbon protein involved in translation (DUF1610 family)